MPPLPALATVRLSSSPCSWACLETRALAALWRQSAQWPAGTRGPSEGIVGHACPNVMQTGAIHEQFLWKMLWGAWHAQACTGAPGRRGAQQPNQKRRPALACHSSCCSALASSRDYPSDRWSQDAMRPVGRLAEACVHNVTTLVAGSSWTTYNLAGAREPTGSEATHRGRSAAGRNTAGRGTHTCSRHQQGCPGTKRAARAREARPACP